MKHCAQRAKTKTCSTAIENLIKVQMGHTGGVIQSEEIYNGSRTLVSR